MTTLRFFAAAMLAATGLNGAPAVAAPIVTDDPILYWNEVALAGVTGAGTVQVRAYAMVNVAMHDAVNRTLGGPNNAYLTGVVAPGGDTRAAASVAARDVLAALYPNPVNVAAFDAALAGSLALVPDGPDKAAGIETGAAYAAAILAARADDGSAAPNTYAPSGLPGRWAPTPPGLVPGATPMWGGVDPFLLGAGDQFRPGPPPAIDSPEYAAAYNEVKEIGSATSATRTEDQRQAALAWDPATGATWLRIAVELADAGAEMATIEYAQMFGRLGLALADAGVAIWDAKYFYDYWRPVTAIRAGDTDGNALTEADPDWSPLFNTPPHPSYVSAHSAFSSASAEILGSVFGDAYSFCLPAGFDPPRCFDGFSDAATDAGNSRLWGGIHYRFDSEAGMEIGRSVGQLVLASPVFDEVPEPGALALFGLGLAAVAARRSARRSGGGA